MAVNPKDNTILVAGSANGWTGGGLPLGLARYTANGQLDMTFNKTGVLTFSPSGVQNNVSTDVAAVELQSGGQIVMAVNLYYGSGPTVAALMRFTSTGQLDGSFGNGGMATLPVPPGDTGSVVYDIIVDGNDNIITSGISTGSNSLMLTRFNIRRSFGHDLRRVLRHARRQYGLCYGEFRDHATGTRLGRRRQHRDRRLCYPQHQ